MRGRYLEVTYRKGKAIAAYLYLPRESNDVSVSVEPRGDGLLVDRSQDGRAIGVEITDPSRLTLPAINLILHDLAQDPLTIEEAAPLLAA